jgi:hypothetical protein
MTAKCKYGCDLLHPLSKTITSKDGKFIINFKHKWTYLSFIQWKNYIIITVIEKDIGFVFTGEVPKLEFESYNKDQLILKIK